MASTNFTNLPRALAKADIDFDTATFKTLLVSSVPSEANFDAWANRSDIGNEITGTNYTAGGVAQAFTLSALDTANNRQAVVWTDLTNAWTTATFSAVGAIIYKNSGSAATDTLLHFVDFNGTISCTAGNFSVAYTSNFLITR